MNRPEPRPSWRQRLLEGRPGAELRRLRLSLGLLLGRREVLFLILDAVLVIGQLLLMWIAGGGLSQVYRSVTLHPLLLLGVPAMANLVALERQAGSLDLALTTASVEAYFLRRIGAVLTITGAQALLVLLGFWFFGTDPFPLVSVVLQVLAANALLGSVVLFWAVHVHSAGAVWSASVITILLLQRWFFFDPMPNRYHSKSGIFLPSAEEALEWSTHLAVLIAAIVLFFLYARRRLLRPETLLK